MRGSVGLVVLAVLAFAAACSLLDIVSWDYWWQLRTGRLIWETGSVPTVDPYSFTAPGAPYVDIHWLFQLWLHATHALGGHAAVVVGKLLFVVLTLALLAPIGGRADRAAVSGVALGLVVVLLAERIMPRAELPSFALLAGVLLALDRMRGPDSRFAWLVILAVQLVWANTHGLYAVGIAVCGIHLAGDGFERLSRGGAPNAPFTRLTIVIAGSIMLAFVNPNGAQGVLYPITQLGMIGATETRALGASIVELQPTLDSVSPTMLVAASSLFALALIGLLANRRAAPDRDWLLLAAFAYLAITARRNLALFAIVAAPIAVTHWNAWLDGRPVLDAPRRRLIATVAVVVVLAAGVADVWSGGFHRRLGIPREPGLGIMQTWFSEGAAEWIATARPPGPIAHAMADGGLLIERLYPDYRVMVDGRLEVYGSTLFDRLQWSTPEQFLSLHREYRFGTVIVHYSKFPSREMLRWLQTRPAWKLAFVDEVSAVYVRDPVREGRFTALDVDDEALFPPFVDEGRTQSELRLRARALFYSALDRRGKAQAAVERARALYPGLDLTAD